MAGNKNADSTNISRKYLDSLVIESRILGAEHPNAALDILGCHFETPVMGAALSHLKGGMAGYAEGFKDAGALVSVGMGSAEELKEILATGAKDLSSIDGSVLHKAWWLTGTEE